MCMEKLYEASLIDNLPYCGTYYKVVVVTKSGLYVPRFKSSGRADIDQTPYGLGTVEARVAPGCCAERAEVVGGSGAYDIGFHAFRLKDDAHKLRMNSGTSDRGWHKVIAVRIFRRDILAIGEEQKYWGGFNGPTVVAKKMRVLADKAH